MTTLGLTCACGAVRGVLRDATPRRVHRVICYCTDCQAFANHLKRGETVLDAHGGTDILQMSSRHVEFDSGIDELACLRLTARGLFRWYTRCCRTPIGNTPPTARAPFVGLIHSFVEGNDPYAGLSPPRGINGRSATGDLSSLQAHPGLPLSSVLRPLALLGAAWWRGDAKRSPFFDDAGQPRVTPVMLGP